MVVLRVFYDGVSNQFPVAENGLVVVIGRQITVDHFSMVSHSDLRFYTILIKFFRNYLSFSKYRLVKRTNKRINSLIIIYSLTYNNRPMVSLQTFPDHYYSHAILGIDKQLLLTANLLALAILFSIRLSTA